MTVLRNLALALLVVLVVGVQSAVVGRVTVLGVAPDLVLLLVVAVALVRGPEVGAVTGFLAGLAVDLAPPADHVAGRWALALALAGHVAGRLDARAGHDRVGRLESVAPAAAAAAVAGVCFALTGLLVHDRSGNLLVVVPLGVVLTTVVAPFVLPALVRLLAGGERPRRGRRRVVASRQLLSYDVTSGTNDVVGRQLSRSGD